MTTRSTYSYDDSADDALLMEGAAPTWECPEGICECAEHRHTEPYEHHVVLCAANGERLPSGRFCAKANGFTVMESTADGAGTATIAFRRRPKAFYLKWAPAGSSEYKYHQLYHLLGPEDSRDEANRKRLHNLGFFLQPTLRDNVIEFQRCYHYEDVSGELADIEHDLVKFHDEHAIPVRQTVPPA